MSPAAPMYAIHPCLLIATDKDGKMRDSFSVLASFGGTFKTTADAGGKTVSADGGVAQYFATGIAAQTLALNGGAAVVAGGSAATAASAKPPTTIEGITPTDADYTAAIKVTSAYDPLRDALAAKVAITDPASLAADFTAFEGAIADPKLALLSICKTPERCAKYIRENEYIRNFTADPVKFEKAVRAWP